MSTKVEEYKGHIEVYAQQLDVRQEEMKSLNDERKEVYASLLNSQMQLSKFKVMFYSVLIGVAAVTIRLGLMMRLNLIQRG